MSVSVNKGYTESAAMTAGIRYCVAQGAKVINISQSGGTQGPGQLDALIEAQEKGVLIVAAAGNFGDLKGGAWSGAFGVLQVGGVMADRQMHPKSDRGIRRGHSGLIKAQGNGVCGPFSVSSSVAIWGAAPGGGYSKSNGTSTATAVVSGVVAAVWSKYPELSAGQVIRRVLATAKPLGKDPVPDAECGWGIVDAYQAVSADVPAGDRTNPLGALKRGAWSDKWQALHTESMGEWDRSYRPGISPGGSGKSQDSFRIPDGFRWVIPVIGGWVFLTVVVAGVIIWRRRM